MFSVLSRRTDQCNDGKWECSITSVLGVLTQYQRKIENFRIPWNVFNRTGSNQRRSTVYTRFLVDLAKRRTTELNSLGLRGTVCALDRVESLDTPFPLTK